MPCGRHFLRPCRGRRYYMDLTVAPLRNALRESRKSLLGIGQLAARSDATLGL